MLIPILLALFLYPTIATSVALGYKVKLNFFSNMTASENDVLTICAKVDRDLSINASAFSPGFQIHHIFQPEYSNFFFNNTNPLNFDCVTDKQKNVNGTVFDFGELPKEYNAVHFFYNILTDQYGCPGYELSYMDTMIVNRTAIDVLDPTPSACNDK
jgi:hypothetical protein